MASATAFRITADFAPSAYRVDRPNASADAFSMLLALRNGITMTQG
jgi:hypothetical protein